MRSLKSKVSPQTIDCCITIVQEIDKHDETDSDVRPLYTILRSIHADRIDLSASLRGAIDQTGNFGSCMLVGVIDFFGTHANKEEALEERMILGLVAELARYFKRRLRTKGKDWAERELVKYFLATVRRRLVDRTSSPFHEKQKQAQILSLITSLNTNLALSEIKTDANG